MSIAIIALSAITLAAVVCCYIRINNGLRRLTEANKRNWRQIRSHHIRLISIHSRMYQLERQEPVTMLPFPVMTRREAD